MGDQTAETAPRMLATWRPGRAASSRQAVGWVPNPMPVSECSRTNRLLTPGRQSGWRLAERPIRASRTSDQPRFEEQRRHSGLETDHQSPNADGRSASAGQGGMAGHAACDNVDTGPSGSRACYWRDYYPYAPPPARHGSSGDPPRRSGRASAPGGHAGPAMSASLRRTIARPADSEPGPDVGGRTPDIGRRRVRTEYVDSNPPSSADRALGIQRELARLCRPVAKYAIDAGRAHAKRAGDCGRPGPLRAACPPPSARPVTISAPPDRTDSRICGKGASINVQVARPRFYFCRSDCRPVLAIVSSA